MADLSVTVGSVTLKAANAIIEPVKYGATITAGQVLYRDSADENKYKPAVATGLSTAAAKGIAFSPGGNNDWGVMVTGGQLSLGATLTVGVMYYLSQTSSGLICLFSDLVSTNYITEIGRGHTTSVMTLAFTVTDNQKA